MQVLTRRLHPSCARAAPRAIRASAYSTGSDAAESGAAASGGRFGHKFAVYKGKAALQMSMIGPTWKPTPKGANFVDREGVMFWEFASVNASGGQQSGYGERSYNWEQKVTFGMKAVELGGLLEPKIIDSSNFKLYHDPGKGTSNEGNTTKSFTITPNPDGSYMFNIQQSGKAATRVSVSVPVTLSEMSVIRTLASFAIPHLMGFSYVADSMHTFNAPSQQ